jgi:hypothetical protein
MTFFSPAGSAAPWPFGVAQFTSVCLVAPRDAEGDLRHIFTETARVLRAGGELIVGNISRVWSETDLVAAIPSSLEVALVRPLGRSGSVIGVRFLDALWMHLPRPRVARCLIEALLGPLLLILGILGVGAVNGIARIIDGLDYRNRNQLGTLLVAVKLSK